MAIKCTTCQLCLGLQITISMCVYRISPLYMFSQEIPTTSLLRFVGPTEHHTTQQSSLYIPVSLFTHIHTHFLPTLLPFLVPPVTRFFSFSSLPLAPLCLLCTSQILPRSPNPAPEHHFQTFQPFIIKKNLITIFRFLVCPLEDAHSLTPRDLPVHFPSNQRHVALFL